MWVNIQGDRVSALAYDPQEVNQFLADTFGGTPKEFAQAPAAPILITNRSGVEGLEESYKARLVAIGIDEAKIMTREVDFDAIGTRVLTTLEHWQDADYYADLLGTNKQQVDSIADLNGETIGLELVLGEDALTPFVTQKESSRATLN